MSYEVWLGSFAPSGWWVHSAWPHGCHLVRTSWNHGARHYVRVVSRWRHARVIHGTHSHWTWPGSILEWNGIAMPVIFGRRPLLMHTHRHHTPRTHRRGHSRLRPVVWMWVRIIRSLSVSHLHLIVNGVRGWVWHRLRWRLIARIARR